MSENESSDGIDLADFSKKVEKSPTDTPKENSRPKGSGGPDSTATMSSHEAHSAAELEAVFDIPVSIQAVLGRTKLEVSNLLGLNSGDVIELDRKVGEAIDIYVNNSLVARGEIVLVDDRLGITMTEIIKNDRTN